MARRTYTIGFTLILAAGTTLGACGQPGEEGMEDRAGAEGEPEATREGTERAQRGMERPATGEAASEGLRVDTLEGVGPYLTNLDGRALYLLEGEPRDSSTCYDACAREWPPLLAGETAPRSVAPSVHADRIRTFERRGGQRQVSYGGHPLYYYHDDTGPGDTEGQEVADRWGEWYLVRPTGEPLEGRPGGGS